MIEIYSAGPEVLHRRLELQEGFVDGIAAVFRARGAADRFACEALVAAIATLTTNALVEGGPAAVTALRAPLVEIAARLFP